MSPVSRTAPPGPSTRSTSEDSFSSASRPRCVPESAGASTRTTRSPTTACCPATGAWTGTPRSTAAASAAAIGGGGGPARGRCHTARTSTVASTAGAPPVWSSSPWVSTSRSRSSGPCRRSQAAARPSRPVSTSTCAAALVSRKASPCPTSIAVRTNEPGGVGAGTAVTTQHPTTSVAASRRPQRSSSHPIAATTPMRTAGSCHPTTGPHHCSRRAAASTTPSAGRARTSATCASPGAGRTMTAAVVQSSEATAAAGTATRFAGSVDRPTSLPLLSRTGRTATWAPIVTASRSSTRPARTTGSSGSRRSRMRGATTRTPSVAAADSSRPSRRVSSGSSSTRTRTAPASAWRGATRRPRAPATSTSAAMALARSTEGSARVRTANSASTTTARRRRPRAPRPTAPPASHAPVTTSATLEPDTAVRWVSPVARMASSSGAGSRLVSPVTSPVARPACPGGSAAAAASANAVRSRVVPAATGPGPSTRSSCARVRRATTCRRCCHGCVATRTSTVPA